MFDAQVLLHSLQYTRALGSPSALHVIAFSGGVDSSLVTFLLSQAYPHFTQSLESSRVPTVARAPVKSTSSSESASVVACIGISPSLPEAQLQMARQVAAHIGVPLWEVRATVAVRFTVYDASA